MPDKVYVVTRGMEHDGGSTVAICVFLDVAEQYAAAERKNWEQQQERARNAGERFSEDDLWSTEWVEVEPRECVKCWESGMEYVMISEWELQTSFSLEQTQVTEEAG